MSILRPPIYHARRINLHAPPWCSGLGMITTTQAPMRFSRYVPAALKINQAQRDDQNFADLLRPLLWPRNLREGGGLQLLLRPTLLGCLRILPPHDIDMAGMNCWCAIHVQCRLADFANCQLGTRLGRLTLERFYDLGADLPNRCFLNSFDLKRRRFPSPAVLILPRHESRIPHRLLAEMGGREEKADDRDICGHHAPKREFSSAKNASPNAPTLLMEPCHQIAQSHGVFVFWGNDRRRCNNHSAESSSPKCNHSNAIQSRLSHRFPAPLPASPTPMAAGGQTPTR